MVKESRTFVGKAQVLEVEGGSVRARLFFTSEGHSVAAGYDAVLSETEQSPDGPPVQTDRSSLISLQGGKTSKITLPFRDPEGGPTGLRWTLSGGKTGQYGVMHHRHSGDGTLTWTRQFRW